MPAKSKTAAGAIKAFQELDGERRKQLAEIVLAIAHLPRGAARSRLITRAVGELSISRQRLEAAIQEAKPSWPPEAWAAEAAYLKDHIAHLIAKGGQNGEIARCRISLEEALKRSA